MIRSIVIIRMRMRECFSTFSHRVCLAFVMLVAYTICAKSENIVFEDSQVKQVCLSKWDADEDGELSIEEAAQVESLGTTFYMNKSLSAFTELQYFTGLTTIDEYAFAESTITSVVIPGNVKQIGSYAFDKCYSLTRVTVNEGVETVGCFAFVGPLEFLSLPSSITYLDHQFVDPFVGSNTTTSGGMSFPDGTFYLYAHGDSPSACHYNAFYRLFGVSYLVVPFGKKADYSVAMGWKWFYKVLEYGDVNRDGRVDVADLTLLIAYIGGREHTDMDALIADINGDGVLDGEDVSQLCQYLLGS